MKTISINVLCGKMSEGHPLHEALCVFKTGLNIFMLGYITDAIAYPVVKKYGKNIAYSTQAFESYQYILNKDGGFIFITEKQDDDIYFCNSCHALHEEECCCSENEE